MFSGEEWNRDAGRRILVASAIQCLYRRRHSFERIVPCIKRSINPAIIPCSAGFESIGGSLDDLKDGTHGRNDELDSETERVALSE